MTSWLNSRLVAVDAGVEVVAAAGDLGVDEAAPVGVVERGVGDADLRRCRPVAGSRSARMWAKCWSKLPAAASACGAGPGVVVPEAVDGHHVVVDRPCAWGGTVSGAVLSGTSPDEGSGSAVDDLVGRVGDGHPAVHGDVGVAAEYQPVGELGDGDDWHPTRVEGGDLRRQVPVGVRPRRRAPRRRCRSRSPGRCRPGRRRCRRGR